jgi:hypothetical protein
MELHENLDILVTMNSWSLNFHSGSRKYMKILIIEIMFPIYYVLHN